MKLVVFLMQILPKQNPSSDVIESSVRHAEIEVFQIILYMYHCAKAKVASQGRLN